MNRAISGVLLLTVLQKNGTPRPILLFTREILPEGMPGGGLIYPQLHVAFETVERMESSTTHSF